MQNSNKFYYSVLKACHKLKNTLNFGKHDKKKCHGSTWIKIEILKKTKKKNLNYRTSEIIKKHNKLMWKLFLRRMREKLHQKEFKNAFKLYEFIKYFINHKIWEEGIIKSFFTNPLDFWWIFKYTFFPVLKERSKQFRDSIITYKSSKYTTYTDFINQSTLYQNLLVKFKHLICSVKKIHFLRWFL